MSTLILLAALSILILVHEAGHFVAARRLGVRVDRFSIGFGPTVVAWRRGATEYRVSILPLGGYVKMAGESSGDQTGAAWEYGSRPVWQRAGIVLAGPLVNYLTGLLLFIAVFWSGAPTLTPRVGEVLEGYPAAQAGLRPGDEIVALNGQPIGTWEQLTEQIRRQTSGEAIRLQIRRAEGETLVTVSPRVQEGMTLFGRRTRVAVVGMMPAGQVRLVRSSGREAIGRGIQKTWWLTVMTYRSLWQVATGAMPVRESLTGPIGIFALTASAAALGWRYVAQLLAVLSVSLAIFNVLPIPVLDGGHLLFLAWEQVRRRPVSRRVQEVATQAGLCLLLGVLLVVTYHDVMTFQVVERITGLFR